MKRLAWLGLLATFATTACAGTPVKHVKPPTKDDAPMKVAHETTRVADPVEEEEAKDPPAPVKDLVHLDLLPTRSVLSANEDHKLVVRVRLTADAIPTVKRPPMSLVLVVDTSGSMIGEPIEQARIAASTLVDKLADGDRLALVAFGTNPEVLVPSTIIDAKAKADIKTKIAEMKARGTTNMSSGLAQGLAQFNRGRVQNGINRIVLLGDGVPNVPQQTLNFAQQAKASGIAITALGLGAEFDETLMLKVAQRSGGTFHFIDEPNRVAKVFEKEVTRLARLVAKSGHVDITPGPGVEVVRAYGLNGSRVGRTFRVHVGQLSEGQVRDVMLEVSVNRRASDATIELADTAFHYADAALGGGQRKVEKFVALRTSADDDAIVEGRHPEVEKAAVKVQVADMFVRAITLARSGDVKTARKLLVDAERLARVSAKRFDDAQLREKVAEARELRGTVAKLAPPPLPRQPRWPAGGVKVPPVPRPMMAPMPKPQALGLRRLHDSALGTIHGGK